MTQNADYVAQVAWLLWCFNQGYTNAADRAIMHNWLLDDPETLHPKDAEQRPHLLQMAAELIEAVRHIDRSGADS